LANLRATEGFFAYRNLLCLALLNGMGYLLPLRPLPLIRLSSLANSGPRMRLSVLTANKLPRHARSVLFHVSSTPDNIAPHQASKHSYEHSAKIEKSSHFFLKRPFFNDGLDLPPLRAALFDGPFLDFATYNHHLS
jgi:hypothetical protein